MEPSSTTNLVGLEDGISLGKTDGELEGCILGASLAFDGVPEGAVDGLLLGASEVELGDSLLEGIALGEADGEHSNGGSHGISTVYAQ